MAIPTTLESLSTTAASNGPSGSDDRSTADDGLRYAYAFIRQTVSLGSNIASATTITPPSTGYAFNITGTTTITTIASTNSWDGRLILLIFAGALTLTHSSNLALPGSTNITTAANDIAEFVQTASGAWRLVTFRTASGVITVPGQSVGSGITVSGTSGGNAEIDIINTNNTASSKAALFLQVAGASADDAYTRLNVSGVTDWAYGIDNSDNDKFKISKNSTLGTSDFFALDTSGNLTHTVTGTSPTLNDNSTMSFELTSNTSLKVVVRGTDGVTRSVSLTLA